MVGVIADVLAFSIGLGLIYLWSADFGRYSVLSVGTYRRVTSRETAGYDCLDCGEEAREERVAGRELVLFGVPVCTLDSTTNTYCYGHASFEFRQDHDRVPISRTTTPDRSPSPAEGFDSVVQNPGDAFALAGVALLVIPAALVMRGFAGSIENAIPDEEELES